MTPGGPEDLAAFESNWDAVVNGIGKQFHPALGINKQERPREAVRCPLQPCARANEGLRISDVPLPEGAWRRGHVAIAGASREGRRRL